MLDALPAPILLDISILFTALSWGLGFYIVARHVYVFASLAIGCFVCLLGYTRESRVSLPMTNQEQANRRADAHDVAMLLGGRFEPRLEGDDGATFSCQKTGHPAVPRLAPGVVRQITSTSAIRGVTFAGP
jgi:hypothetical protein